MIFLQNLKQLLESSVNGRNLLSNYNTNKFLTSKERQYIVKIIADIWVNLERQITKSDYNSAADQIVLLFPTEDKVNSDKIFKTFLLLFLF